jgi:outer membrane protein assembly factor BamB
MTQSMRLEELLADWMVDEATGAGSEDVVRATMDVVRHTARRPRWLAVVREPAMRADRRRVVVGVARARLVAVALLLLLGAVALGGAAAFLLNRAPGPSATWSGYRGDAGHAGVAGEGPVGNPPVAWRVTLGAGIARAVAVSGESVIVTSDDGVVHALSIRDGAHRWTYPSAPPVRSPFVASDRVFIADGAGRLHALALSDGGVEWDSTTAVDGPSDVIVIGSDVVVGTADGLLVAFDATTGNERWRVKVSPSGQIVQPPAAASDTVVTTSGDGFVTVVELATGSIRWQVRADVGAEPLGPPVVAGGVVYAGMAAEALGGRLTALDVATGRTIWQLDQAVYAPSVADGIGYTGSGIGRVAAIDLRTGSERWADAFTGTVRAPAVAGDALYVAADAERRVVALERATGGELWEVPLDGPDSCCIAVAGGFVITGTTAGTIMAIGGDGGAVAPAPRRTVEPSRPSSPAVTPVPAESTTPLAARLVWTSDPVPPHFVPCNLTRSPDGRLWVTEGLGDRFAIFDPDGRFVETWGTTGKGRGEFDLTRANGDPFGAVAFGADGTIFVLDVGNHRVQHFDSHRNFIGEWGEFGPKPGQFLDPVSIAVEVDGTVAVLDDERGVIERFTAAGKRVRTVSAFPAAIGPNQGAGRLTIGPNGDFYVSVAFPNEVAELDHDGNLVRIYGGAAAGTGQLRDQPGAVAFDREGRVFVTQGPVRGDAPAVLAFSPDGSYAGGFGEVGSAEDDITFPSGLLIEDDGIVVADAGSEFGFASRLRKFALNPAP